MEHARTVDAKLVRETGVEVRRRRVGDGASVPDRNTAACRRADTWSPKIVC